MANNGNAVADYISAADSVTDWVAHDVKSKEHLLQIEVISPKTLENAITTQTNIQHLVGRANEAIDYYKNLLVNKENILEKQLIDYPNDLKSLTNMCLSWDALVDANTIQLDKVTLREEHYLAFLEQKDISKLEIANLTKHQKKLKLQTEKVNTLNRSIENFAAYRKNHSKILFILIAHLNELQKRDLAQRKLIIQLQTSVELTHKSERTILSAVITELEKNQVV